MTNCNYFLSPNGLELESGIKLDELRVAYGVYGPEDAEKTVWVCHALSGNSFVPEWWGGLFGDDRFFNFSNYRVICANVVGSCYGTSGPDELEDATEFPFVSIRDMVKAHELLRSYLGVDKIDVLIGASLGGQQALEWSISNPEVVKDLILIATNAEHSPLGRAFNESQRLALQADPTFGQKEGGQAGLKAARAIAMLSYRSYEDFQIKQSDDQDSADDFRAASYVRYQGEKFLSRFKAGAYYTLSKAMDSQNVGRGRGGVEKALSQVKARTLVVGVDSDTLFPLSEQEFLAQHIEGADLGVIHSPYGHDAFLIEYKQLEELIKEFIHNDFKGFKPTVLKPQVNRNEK